MNSSAFGKGMIGVRSYVRYSGATPLSELALNHREFQQVEGSQLPVHGLTLMYGVQVSRKLMGSLLLDIESSGDTFVPVHGVIDIGAPFRGKVGLEDISEVQFLCFPDRTKADLMDFVNTAWLDILQRHGLPTEGEQFPRKPTMHGHLLDELMQVPELSHVSAIAYPVSTRVGVVRLVTVYKREAIEEMRGLSVEGFSLLY